MSNRFQKKFKITREAIVRDSRMKGLAMLLISVPVCLALKLDYATSAIIIIAVESFLLYSSLKAFDNLRS